jgi:hypothetical protein
MPINIKGCTSTTDAQPFLLFYLFTLLPLEGVRESQRGVFLELEIA